MYSNRNKFYDSSEWRKVRKEVLATDKYECQVCRNKYKRYTKANTVHHINHLDKHPELALATHYTDDDGNIKRQLISVCHDCHEVECHPERNGFEIKPQLTEEKW